MQSDVLWSSVEQLCHLLLAQPNRFFGELHIQTNRVIRALVYNYRFVCLTICLHLFCHLLSFPSSLPGHNYLQIFCFFIHLAFIQHSFPRPSREHPERHCRVSIPFILVPFPSPKGTTLTPTLCLFYSLCLFFQSSLKKDTTSCFHSPYSCRALQFI